MIALYVDGILAACNDSTGLVAFKAQLEARFKINDLGDLSQLLGMHITKDMVRAIMIARTISLESRTIRSMSETWPRHHMTDCMSSTPPIKPGFLSGLAKMNSPLLSGVAKTSIPASWAAYNTELSARALMCQRL
jgi:hypothetical protein